MSEEAVAGSVDSQERDELPSLGARLREAREARDLSVEQIADELRIDAHVLRALEADRIADIDVAPVFIKGYIKQYGRMLQLDYDELRDAFQKQTDSEDVRLRPNTSIHLRDERQITMWIIAAIAVLVVGGALALWWFGAEEVRIFNLPGRSAEQDDAAAIAEPRERSVPVAVPAGEPVAAPANTRRTEPVAPQVSIEPAAEAESLDDTVSVAGADLPGNEPVIAIGESQQTAVVEGGSASVVTADVADPLAAAAVDAPVVVQLPAEPEPGSVPMSFSFSQESWFELRDALGRQLYYDLAGAGDVLNFAALPPARVLIGNADAVSITVSSADFPVPLRSRRDNNVAVFVIDPQQD